MDKNLEPYTHKTEEQASNLVHGVFTVESIDMTIPDQDNFGDLPFMPILKWQSKINCSLSFHDKKNGKEFLRWKFHTLGQSSLTEEALARAVQNLLSNEYASIESRLSSVATDSIPDYSRIIFHCTIGERDLEELFRSLFDPSKWKMAPKYIDQGK